MKTETITKPEHVDTATWQANQQWLQLMSAQASIHRQQQDPRLFRQSARQSLISPVKPTDK